MMTTQHDSQDISLPFWMRQAKQEFDWSILIAIAMSLAIAWTFIVHDEIPGGTQVEHYVFQANDIISGFQEGHLYPRWSPYAMKGYGAPIPNYYPIGTAYSIALIEVLFTNDIYQATRIVFMLAYLLAGVSVYLLVSSRTDSAIGLLATVLYIYSPMIGSTVPYVMGDLSLLISAGLLPLSLWAIYLYIHNSQTSHFIIYTLSIAFALWVHPQMAIISISISGLYAIFSNQHRSVKHRFLRFGFATLIGIMLVTFFWMPALLERNLVNWYSASTIHNFTLSLNQLISPIEQIDSGLLMPQPQFKLGTINIAFAIISVIIFARTQNRFKRIFSITSLASIILLCVVIVIMIPNEVWLLCPIALFLAILGANTLTIRNVLSSRMSRILLVFSVASTIIFSLSTWLVPNTNLTFSDTNAIAQIRFEQQGYGIPTLPDNALLPATISIETQANRTLVNSYELEAPIRYEERQNNANTIVSLLETGAYTQTYRIFNQIPIELEFVLPYFAGWQALLDGIPIKTYANSSNQLTMIDVPPADNSELTITLMPTQIRSLAWIISILALLVILTRIIIPNKNTVNPHTTLLETLPRTDVRLMLFMFASLGILIIVFTSDTPLIQLQAPPAFTLSQSLPLQNRTSAGFEASTFEISKRELNQREQFTVTIYWQALTDIFDNYQTRALLRGMDNRLIWYTGDLKNPSLVPSKRWVRNKFIKDQHSIAISEDILSGEYEVLIEMFPCNDNICDTNRPVIFFDIEGNPVGRQLIIPLSIIIR